MPNELRNRARQLLARESRYFFPYHIRLFLAGLSLGLTIAGILLAVFR